MPIFWLCKNILRYFIDISVCLSTFSSMKEKQSILNTIPHPTLCQDRPGYVSVTKILISGTENNRNFPTKLQAPVG